MIDFAGIIIFLIKISLLPTHYTFLRPVLTIKCPKKNAHDFLFFQPASSSPPRGVLHCVLRGNRDGWAAPIHAAAGDDRLKSIFPPFSALFAVRPNHIK